MKSFIIDVGAFIFDKLRWFSLFQPIQLIFPSTQKNYGFVEMWVIANSVLSILCLAVSCSSYISWWEIILLSYAGIRIFEIVIYQINVLLFDQYRLERLGIPYFLGSYRRIIILLLLNYFEILFWFALFYRNFSSLFHSSNIQLNSFIGSLYYSLVTMSTLGYGDITPAKPIGQIFIVLQTLIGILMALLIIGRFISLLPGPKTIEKSEKKDQFESVDFNKNRPE